MAVHSVTLSKIVSHTWPNIKSEHIEQWTVWGYRVRRLVLGKFDLNLNAGNHVRHDIGHYIQYIENTDATPPHLDVFCVWVAQGICWVSVVFDRWVAH